MCASNVIGFFLSLSNDTNVCGADRHGLSYFFYQTFEECCAFKDLPPTNTKTQSIQLRISYYDREKIVFKNIFFYVTVCIHNVACKCICILVHLPRLGLRSGF